MKFHNVLFIDDNEYDNYYHQKIVEKSKAFEGIYSVQTGKVALEYLKNRISNRLDLPNLIFLDINMPGMNGWEFMEEFNKFPESAKRKIAIHILSTSENPDDKKQAEETDNVLGYLSKPLTLEALLEITKSLNSN